MPPSELPRSTQVSGRHRPLGAFIIILFLCLTSFALGIFIGKHNKVSQQQAVVQAPLTHPVVHSTVVLEGKQPAVGIVVGNDVVTPDIMPVQTTLAASESAFLAVQPLAHGDDKVATPQGGSVSVAVVSEQSPLGNGLNQLDDAVVVAAPVHAVTVKVVPAVVKSIPKVVSNAAGYVVQVGSFKKQEDAEKVKVKVQTKFAVQVKRADLGQKGVWYRVLVGPINSSAEAGKVKDRLQQEFKLAGFVKKNTD